MVPRLSPSTAEAGKTRFDPEFGVSETVSPQASRSVDVVDNGKGAQLETKELIDAKLKELIIVVPDIDAGFQNPRTLFQVLEKDLQHNALLTEGAHTSEGSWKAEGAGRSQGIDCGKEEWTTVTKGFSEIHKVDCDGEQDPATSGGNTKEDEVGGSNDRPWLIRQWIDYVIPARHVMDCLFLLLNPEFWGAATHDFSSHPSPIHVADSLTTEDYLVTNSQVTLTVALVMSSIFFPNFLETGLLLYYRNRFTSKWKLITIHHFALMMFLGMSLTFGRGIICLQALTGFTHLVVLPLSLFRGWKKWESKLRIVTISTW
eukprot:CAMPEP_0184301464 /NCGR_PEP_ID=MMETSP1049-20130417/11655_1 /TAXON_ID=77928 /ORGANISM="Proteomonas sulcata, Strain CCMP704" /LENGTH=315 /DNA_ID=CAMNT_0026612475 /DNA_START=483 /DNA_END=1427 /DNA_ORIENTATION=+